jgi:hypothetical protein
MIAYNRQSLDNLDLQLQAREAFEKNLLAAGEYARIIAAYPFRLYIPNSFIRIGLFLLTCVAASFGLGLLSLMIIDSFDKNIYIVLLVYAAIAVFVLELFIRNQKMHGAGVDDALLWIASALIFTGINLALKEPIPPATQSAIILFLALIGMLRYADRIMALVAYGALLAWVFYTALAWGPVGRGLLPFLIMALSIGCYFLFTTLQTKTSLRHYRTHIILLRLATLVSLYAAGNYFIIRELNASIAGQTASVSLGWLWWLFTFAIPVLYVINGVRKKDVLFLWTGMALASGAILTFRYYYHIVPTEIAMIVAGIVLIAGVYGLTRYLRTPRHGFTATAPNESHLLENLPVEGLVMAESFASVASAPADIGVKFGGGSTGGGGAGGQY